MEAIKEIQTRKTYKRIFHRDVEGVTVAVVEDYLRPIREIQNSCKEEYAAISVVLDSYRHIPDEKLPKIRGVARCGTEDEYDLELGEQLACARADKAYHHRMAQIYKQNIDELKGAIEQFERLEMCHRKKERGREKHIQNLCEKEQ